MERKPQKSWWTDLNFTVKYLDQVTAVLISSYNKDTI